MKSRYIVIRDEHSKLFGHRFLNSQLTLYLGLIQLFFCLWALSQHIWSIFTLKKILHCDFSDNSTLPPLLTHVDAIIFDIGLFHHLWGISGCVAQHLDGGYGRFCWCIAHTFALITCLPLAFLSRPKPRWLWPLLIQQSAYGVGMLILSLAALPKAAHMLGDLRNAPVRAISFYTLGTLMNFFLLYVFWHWYWHVESLWNSARKLRRGETLTKSGRRPTRKMTNNPPPMGGGELAMAERGGGNGNGGECRGDDGTPPARPALSNANGHLRGATATDYFCEKKQMSVTIVEDQHHATTTMGMGMPISRIEPSPGDGADDGVGHLKFSPAPELNHQQVNSTKSLPNGGCPTKEHRHRKMAKFKNCKHMGGGGGGDGMNEWKSAPKLIRKGGGDWGEDSNTSAASSASFSTTTTTALSNNVVFPRSGTNKMPGHQMQHNHGMERILFKPPPSPAPPPPAAARHPYYSPEEALPPRIRHLRREEGGRPKSAQTREGENERRKPSGTGSTTTSIQSSNESRKSSLNQNGQIGHHTKPNGLQPLTARFSMPTNSIGLDPAKLGRQNSRRRRLSLRQRNQIAARKHQQQQQQWMEGEKGTTIGTASSAPSLIVGGRHPNGMEHGRSNGHCCHLPPPPPAYAPSPAPLSAAPTLFWPSPSHRHYRPPLQAASLHWTSVDRFHRLPTFSHHLATNNHPSIHVHQIGNVNGPSPLPMAAICPQQEQSSAAIHQRQQPPKALPPMMVANGGGWGKRLLNGPLNSLPLNFASNGHQWANSSLLRNAQPEV